MKIHINCCVCGTQFEREQKEITRNAKLGRKIYCSRICCGKDNAGNLPPEGSGYDISQYAGSKLDEYSPFRWHYNNCKRRDKEVTINLNDLKEQWEKQKGICPYTGWELKNLPNTSPRNQLPLTPDRASLDRVDSSKGYVKGNIQFVSYMAQCAKHIFAETDLLKFCRDVCNNGESTKERILHDLHRTSR